MIGEFALVMSVKEKKAVVLVSGGRFVQIKNRNFKVGQRILLEPSLLSFSDRVGIVLENTGEKLERLVDRLRYKGLIILSGVAILIPSSGYAAAKFVPWTCVSMDTGSISIQYRVNGLGEVLSTESLSDEAQAVVEALSPVRYEKVGDAIDRAMNVIYADDSPIMEEPEPVMFGISTRVGSGSNTRSAIEEHMEPVTSAAISFEHLNWSDIGKAHEEEVSIGQYSRMMKEGKEAEPGAGRESSDDTMVDPEPRPAAEQNEERHPDPEIQEDSVKGPNLHDIGPEDHSDNIGKPQPFDSSAADDRPDSDNPESGEQQRFPEFRGNEAETENLQPDGVPSVSEEDLSMRNGEIIAEQQEQQTDEALIVLPTGMPLWNDSADEDSASQPGGVPQVSHGDPPGNASFDPPQDHGVPRDGRSGRPGDSNGR